MTSTVNVGRVMRCAGFLLVLAVFFEGVGVSGAASSLRDEQSKSGAKQQPDEKKDDKKDEKKEETLPLKTTRKVSFTTDEGTWMSIDMSPDGKQIVFDLLGDLYLIPSTGGDAKRLTSGPAWDCQPRFSPNGRQIAFISDRNGSDNLWLINVDGSQIEGKEAKKVSEETDDQLGSPAWSPDGNYIVVRKYGQYPGPTDYLRYTSLWMFHKDGGKGVEVVKGGKGETQISSGAVFSADGKLVYFSSHAGRFQYNADIGKFQVMSFNRETGEIERLTSEYGGGLRPIVSPDGKWLVYASRQDAKTGLRIRDLATLEEHWLALPIQRDDQEGFAVNDLLPGYGFTPDSKAVIFTHDGHIQRVELATRQVATIPFNAKVDLDLGPRVHVDYAVEDGPLTVHQMRWTNQSPDGKRIAFSAVGKIWVMDLPDGKPRRLTKGDGREYEPTFSPDGKWIAYVTWSDVDGRFVLIVPSQDGEWLAIQNRYDAYLAAFPKVGDATVNINFKTPEVPLRRLTKEGANYLYWADGGKTLTWSFGNDFYRVKRDVVLNAPKPEKDKPENWKPETFAISLQVPRDTPQGQIFLRGARIVTMKRDEVIAQGDILIENNRIKAIGASGSISAPAGAKVIDVSGKKIVPGLVDIHSHLKTERPEMTNEEWSYAENLAYGVTTTRDPSIESNTVFAQGELVAVGDLAGPRIYSTGTAITTTASGLASAEDADNLVKRYKTHGADSLKEYMQPRRIQRQWLVVAAAKEGVNITAEGGGDLKTDLSMVLDGYTGVEHSLPIVPIYKDVIQLEAQAGTTYTPTLIVSYGGEFGQFYWRQRMDIHADPKVMRFTPHEQVDSVARRRVLLFDEEYSFPLIAQGAAGIVRNGGHVALGSHGEQQGIGAHWELWMLQSGGMTPWQALYSATMNGAESIGLEKQIGSLEPGKLADLLVLNSNPLDDIRNSRDLEYVVKNGVVYSAETLDEVWPTEKKFPEFFWKKDDAELTALPK